MAAIPGRTFPSIASSNAPPPRNIRYAASQTELVNTSYKSPPPTSENAPFLVASTIASPTVREPWVKFSNSNTPIGPFQRIVLDSLITLAKISSVLGPMSRPSHPSGISSTAQNWVLASLEKASAILASTASTRFTPFLLLSWSDPKPSQVCRPHR